MENFGVEKSKTKVKAEIKRDWGEFGKDDINSRFWLFTLKKEKEQNPQNLGQHLQQN